jgi:predicted glycosyltransferase
MQTLTGDHPRVLIYSHDTFGLGHLRRCREIAHTLVRGIDRLSVLILSGSPIIGSFAFEDRVDFVRVPGVIKLSSGDYTSHSLPLDFEETLEIRASIIQHTARIYDPDLFIVDKEPLGLRGELKGTLAQLRAAGTPTVLGLRDVLDEPALLAPEWERKNARQAVVDMYDDIWVYGLQHICDPLDGLDLPPSVAKKTSFTGYLRRDLPEMDAPLLLKKISGPFILVTTGGGGDGEPVIDAVLAAYEADPDLPYPALLVLGPFMQSRIRAEFLERANRLPKVETLTFSVTMEALMNRAAGVVAMGGYNTFCEILSFDKKAIVIPRTEPRLEQYIRAERAQELGLVRMLVDESWRDPRAMATALRTLPQQAPPSRAVVPGLLDGRSNVVKLARRWLSQERRHRPRLRSAGL